MLISVAIPAFNEEKLLPQTLAAVEKAQTAFTERDWETEVVICDNNSTDATAKLAEAAGARVVFEPVNQISRARNAAGNAAQGDWIVFLDADSTPCPALMGKMATLMEDQAVIGAGVQIKMEGITLVAAQESILEHRKPVVPMAGRILRSLPRGSISTAGRFQRKPLRR